MENYSEDKAVKLLYEAKSKWFQVCYEKRIDKGAEDCALCKEYRNTNTGNCGKCPINLYTYHSGCRGTPYDKLITYMFKNSVLHTRIDKDNSSHAEMFKLALDQYNFIECVIHWCTSQYGIMPYDTKEE